MLGFLLLDNDVLRCVEVGKGVAIVVQCLKMISSVIGLPTFGITDETCILIKILNDLP